MIVDNQIILDLRSDVSRAIALLESLDRRLAEQAANYSALEARVRALETASSPLAGILRGAAGGGATTAFLEILGRLLS